MSTTISSVEARSIMLALREDTAPEHRALEGLLTLTSPNLTQQEYVHTLQQFEAFVSTWERGAVATCPPDAMELFESRRRSPLLSADLKFFHAAPLHAQPTMPKLGTAEDFWGSMYVLEGSTLGGQIISRHLESTLHLQDGQGYQFFRGHGEQTGTMWKQFSARLTTEAEHLDREAIIHAARETFRAFSQWFQQTA